MILGLARVKWRKFVTLVAACMVYKIQKDAVGYTKAFLYKMKELKFNLKYSLKLNKF